MTLGPILALAWLVAFVISWVVVALAEIRAERPVADAADELVRGRR